MAANVLLLDGSFAAQISARVGKSPDGDPLWTARFLATDQNAIYETYLDFLRAGSDIIETNTYQASIAGFKKHLDLEEEASLNLIHKAVELARRAIDTYKGEIEGNDRIANRDPLIAGSCGPYGASLHDGSEYTGAYCKDVSKEFLKEWHRPRIETLLKAGVDILAIETIPCPEEAEAIVELLKEYPDAKAWLSFSCNKDGENLANGTSFQEVATRCYRTSTPGQLIAIGANCLSPLIVTKLLKGINAGAKEEDTIPLVVYPNSGEVYSAEEGWKKDTLPSSGPVEFVHEWLDLGVRYIGGCCRTSALDVAKMREKIEIWKLQERETAL